jgi:hypothetical protein
MKRTEISSSTNRESKVGYSRVVRLGSNIFAGTTATDEFGKIIGKDPYVRTIQIIKNIDYLMHNPSLLIL